MSGDYAHFALRDWPFRIVPEPEYCDFLADRTQVRADVNALVTALERRPTSTIQLVWSFYGAGKTHTLFYLANKCVASHPNLIPIYSECPRDAKGFLDVYRGAMAQLNTNLVIDSYLEIATRTTTSRFMRPLHPDLASALTQAALGESARLLMLEQWLQGHALPRSVLRELGVSTKVGTTDQAYEILGDIVGVVTSARSTNTASSTATSRVIWIIDEMQRIEELPKAVQRSILSGIVGVFNRCSTGLTVLLSFSGDPQSAARPPWVPDDLADRIGIEKAFLLPPLRTDEGMVFIKELLAHFRAGGGPQHQPYFPFEEEAVALLVGHLASIGELKPRALMQYFDASLRGNDEAIRSGRLSVIDSEALKRSLSEELPNLGKQAPKKSRRG